jgi:hypothetical protein
MSVFPISASRDFAVRENFLRATEGEFTFDLLPHSEQNASGCLVEMEDNEPSQKGPLVYLSVEGRIDAAVAEVERNNS